MKSSLLLALSVCLFMNASAAGTPGLAYNYYEGTWNSLPDFTTLTPIKKGVTANMTLDPRRREQEYAFLWQGFITIPATGNYTFETNSDDGSKLYIGRYGFNTVPIVDNDGLHPNRFVTGTISLNAGVYPISISFFQNGGNQTMEVYWSSNSGLSRTLLANNFLTIDDPGIVAGLTCSYFEGVWDSLPNFRIIPYIKKEPA
ncbi:MAG: PA14 domain-containing protein, partial [Chitinophagaceae bacterium]